MLAYHNDPAIKAKYLERLSQHRAADQLLQHFGYWCGGKGCAIGCTIHGDDHAVYETELGVPQMLAQLKDIIFESLPPPLARLWPERFLSAIRPGQDLSRVGWQLLHWLLTDPAVNPGITHPLVADAVRECAAAIKPRTVGEPVDREAARRAANAARRAWRAANAVDSAAAYSAESGASAAESGASAENAAWAVTAAAYSAASAASAVWEKIADKLIELIEAAP